MEKEYKNGDLFYRFKFSLNGLVTVDIFEAVSVNKTNLIRLEPVDEESNTSFKQGISFCPKGNIGVVKTKSLNKYIMLDEDNEQEARRILLEYVTRQRDEFEQKLKRAEEWILVAKGENHGLNQETVGNCTPWHELFGTPERAARTMVNIGEHVNFDGIGGDYDTILEWLRGDE